MKRLATPTFLVVLVCGRSTIYHHKRDVKIYPQMDPNVRFPTGSTGFTNVHYMSPLYFLPVCFGEFSPTCSAKALQIALQRFGIAWQFRPQTS